MEIKPRVEFKEKSYIVTTKISKQLTNCAGKTRRMTDSQQLAEKSGQKTWQMNENQQTAEKSGQKTQQ